MVSFDFKMLSRPAAQLNQPVMPAKHPPTGLKLIREVEMDYNCCSVCHQQGYTYNRPIGGECT